jgi:hypothetical protein
MPMERSGQRKSEKNKLEVTRDTFALSFILPTQDADLALCMPPTMFDRGKKKEPASRARILQMQAAVVTEELLKMLMHPYTRVLDQLSYLLGRVVPEFVTFGFAVLFVNTQLQQWLPP